MELKRLKIADIKVKDRARVDKGMIEDLAISIKEKGLIQPITVNSDMRLLAGERRLLAHQFLELTHIDAVVRPGNDVVDALEVELVENLHRKDMTWPETCVLEKRIFDEKAKHGKWNQRKQAEMLDHSQGIVSMRIQMAEALEFIPDLADNKTFDEAWKEYKKLEENFHVEELVKRTAADPKYAQASKWATDHYKVGDAIEGMRTVHSDVIDFAEVDPPYGVQLDTRKGRNSKNNMADYNEVDESEYEIFMKEVISEVYRTLKKDAFAVFWYGWDWHSDMRNWLLEAGFAVPTIPAIWAKGMAGQTGSPDTTLGSCHEPFWLARKGQPKLVRPGRSNVFHFEPVPPTRKIHPTERPLILMSEIISLCCFPGSIVMSPFLGSGVTLRATYKVNCTGFGWDLSEENKRKFLKAVMSDASGDPVEEEEEDANNPV